MLSSEHPDPRGHPWSRLPGSRRRAISVEPEGRHSAGVTIEEWSDSLASADVDLDPNTPLITIGRLKGPDSYTSSDFTDIDWFGEDGVAIADGGTRAPPHLQARDTMERWSILMILSGLFIAACGDGAPAAAAADWVVRDSAGIIIVENHAPAWREGDRWRVSEEPVLEIGMIDGPAAYQLDRVQHAARLEDGSVVVADGGSGQLRIFDSGGRHVISMGGRGGGPGEFATLSYAGPFRSDSIAAWDASTKRLTVFSADGQVGRTWSVEGVDGLFVQTLGWFGDGSLALSVPGESAAQINREVGEQREQRAYVRSAPNGNIDTLAIVPGREYVFHGSNPPFGTGEVLFARNAHASSTHDMLVAGESGQYALAYFSYDGSLRREVRLMAPPRTVTPDELAEATARAAERQERSARRMAEVMDRPVPERLPEVPYRATHPFFDTLTLAKDGHLWVREPARPDSAGPETWQVIDPDGVWLGSVETPAGLRVSEIGPDYLLGIARDAYDVEHVRMYRLERGNSR